MKVENGTSSILYTFNEEELLRQVNTLGIIRNGYDFAQEQIKLKLNDEISKEIEKLKRKNERLKLIEKLCAVPKFKIGQEVWYVYDKLQNVPFKFIVKGYYHCDISNSFIYVSDDYITFEKYLFATKEEAELKLKEFQK